MVNHKKQNVTAIVLAAGKSSRMEDHNKLFTKIAGRSVLQHVLGNIKQSWVSNIIVVAGYQSTRTEALTSDLKVTCVVNKKFLSGISASIRAGIEGLSNNVDAILICHGDMPFVSSQVINQTINALDKHESQIVIPTFLGQRGNPLLWPRIYFKDLCNLKGDRGAKQILKKYTKRTIEIDVGNIGILLDIDNSFTLESFKSLFNN